LVPGKAGLHTIDTGTAIRPDAERRFQYLVRSIRDYAIYMLELDGTVSSWNIGAERLQGYRAEEILGRHFSCFYLHEDCAVGVPDQALRVAREAGRFEAEGWRLRKDGTRFWANVVIEPIHDDDGVIVGFAQVTKDLTRQKADAEQIRDLVLHDQLTGLANRKFFREFLRQRLADRRWSRGAAVLLLDIDGFRSINDTYGHSAGDTVLAEIASRVRLILRGEDIAARLGGDIFGIVLHGIALQAAMVVAERLLSAIRVPIHVGQYMLTVTASIGIEILSEKHLGVDDVHMRAELALKQAKARGISAIQVVADELGQKVEARRTLEHDLSEAIENNNGLTVHYQPIVDLATGEVMFFEALLRWQHDRRGAVPPGIFVPFAEEVGLIEALGQWVLLNVCREAASWRDSARVAVNVSALQLRPCFADQVFAALSESGLEAERLELEITETALLDVAVARLGELHKLRAAGVRIALDDFGVGYSSLLHVRAFPFDRIKIDGSFVRDATSRMDCAVIVGIVAELAARLGISVVAEGVETQEQLDLARREGCHLAQGFLIGRPAPRALNA